MCWPGYHGAESFCGAVASRAECAPRATGAHVPKPLTLCRVMSKPGKKPNSQNDYSYFGVWRTPIFFAGT